MCFLLFLTLIFNPFQQAIETVLFQWGPLCFLQGRSWREPQCQSKISVVNINNPHTKKAATDKQ